MWKEFLNILGWQNEYHRKHKKVFSGNIRFGETHNQWNFVGNTFEEKSNFGNRKSVQTKK